MLRTFPQLMRLGLGTGALAVAVAGCSIDRQSHSSITAPAEFGNAAMVLTASPQALMHDGTSQSVITALVADASGKPVPNVSVRWEGNGTTSRATPVRLSAQHTVTDANGRTAVTLTAPPPPTELPPTPDEIIVFATPLPTQQGEVESDPRTLVVRLIPPPELLPGHSGGGLAARFLVTPQSPRVGQEVVFDASGSTVTTGRAIVAYRWEFGDGTSEDTARPLVQHTYDEARVRTVTLTVVDNQGGTSTTAQRITISD